MTRQTARAIASDLSQQFGPRVKAVHIQPLGTSRIKITVFLKPLASKDIPEPECHIFNADEL